MTRSRLAIVGLLAALLIAWASVMVSLAYADAAPGLDPSQTYRALHPGRWWSLLAAGIGLLGVFVWQTVLLSGGKRAASETGP